MIADTSRARRTGLLNHTGLRRGEGLWIVPCEGVHTFGMKFAIDLVFLDKRKTVVKLRRNVAKRRIAFSLRAHSVLELPVGAIDASGASLGDQLELIRS